MGSLTIQNAGLSCLRLCGIATALFGIRALLGVARKQKEEKSSLKTGKTALDRLNSFDLKIKQFENPAYTKLIGSGRAKLVYSGYRKALISSEGSQAVSIDDIVYMIARNRFWNSDELHNEIRIGLSIRNGVYLANLQVLLESMGQNPVKAKSLAKNLVIQFPTIEALVQGLNAEDQRLKDFFFKNSMGSVDWNSPAMQRLIDSCLHLAVDFVFAPTISIHGKSPVIAKKAECDLEAAVRKKEYKFPQSASLTHQLMKGFRDLHAGGYIHGDTKLENILVYRWEGKPVVKIADWGKCKKLTNKGIAFYTGNHRHMPPERISSQKGEVFGVAMMVVRILEEEFLTDSTHAMLVEPDTKDAVKEKLLREENHVTKSRKGIERYLSLCKGCPEIDANWSDAMTHVLGSFKSFISKSHTNIDSQVGKYLNALQKSLEKQYGDSDEKRAAIGKLIALLTAMTRSNKAERITMEEAVPRLETCLLPWACLPTP